MTSADFHHDFVCECGTQGRAVTWVLWDCKCGRSRQYIFSGGKLHVIRFSAMWNQAQ